MPRLRVGIVDYLNSKPLAWNFLRGKLEDRFEPVYRPPARVAEMLAEGSVDIGLIPTIEYQRIPDLSVVPGVCVAADREVRSVILVSRVEPSRITRLALDENSRTSACLVRIILRRRYGVDPAIEPASPDVDAMLASHDAALLIGDPALTVDRCGFHVLDLAREWRLMTGYPFVFAFWAVRQSVSAERATGLAEVFRASLDAGLAAIDRLAEDASRELGISVAEAREYLTENLRFGLGESELAGLREYFRLAHEAGLTHRNLPIRLVR